VISEFYPKEYFLSNQFKLISYAAIKDISELKRQP